MPSQVTLTRRQLLRGAVAGGVALAGSSTRRSCGHARGDVQTEFDGRFDEYVERAMAEWDVPGLAVAVVRDSEVILARGYGVRQLGQTAAVTADTLFPIASSTKSFTAAAAAKLVDQGRIHWDDPLSNLIPALRLPEPDDGSTPTIRHALSHRTGLPAANTLWRTGALGVDDILSRIQFLTPVARPGERFRYNNVMYLAAGEAIAHASGTHWADFVRTEFFEPLEMNRSVASVSELGRFDDVALPHATVNGQAQTIERHCPDVIAPAGAIHSTAPDMARWLLLHLGRGRTSGNQLLSDARIDEMHRPAPSGPGDQPSDPDVPRSPVDRYGLGWFVNMHAGRTIVEHAGSQNGFVSWMAMMPREQLGVVILSNQHRAGINYALRFWIFDRLLGRPEQDWSTTVRDDYANAQQKLDDAKADFAARRIADRLPSRQLPDFAGVYESTLYGTARISMMGARLELRCGRRFHGVLEHWEDDTFRVFFRDPMLADWLVTFESAAGKIVALHALDTPWSPDWYDHDDLGVFRRT